jgi:hypothetical protein
MELNSSLLLFAIPDGFLMDRLSLTPFGSPMIFRDLGQVAERLKAPVSKTGIR